MRKYSLIIYTVCLAICCISCTRSYKAKPLPFKHPSVYPNAVTVADAVLGSKAFTEKSEAAEAFGFDIRSSGMLPVQIVVDNQGKNPLIIIPEQTFLLDREGNLWPILSDRFAYERVTKYAQTKQIFQEGAYVAAISGVAGAVLGAAVGIVTDENVASAAGKGAAVGTAAGAAIGGLDGYSTAEVARRRVMEDFEDKKLQNKVLLPGMLNYGFLFFPGEAKSAQSLRLQLKNQDSGQTYTINLVLSQ